MSPRVHTHERAKQDLAEQAEQIRQDSPQAALRFLEAAEHSFEQLARMPGLGARHECKNPRLANLRCWRVRGFEKHLIFYLPVRDGIEVVRVLHGARDINPILERTILD